jgi:hypothetical protein
VSSTDLRRNALGQPVSAPTFEDTGGIHPQWKGHKYIATAGQTNIYDEVVTVEKQLRGGWYELLDATPKAVVNDYIEFAVVDKDDALGLFSSLGLTVGVDILELKKYVAKEYINPSLSGRQVFMANSTFTIVAGLYLRTIYESTGADNVCFKVVTLAYE